MRKLQCLLAVVAGIAATAAATAGHADAGYVFAVSWQPAFCETRPDKAECENQTADRFDATSFALHGLWPQPRDNVYCGVPADQRAADEAGRWAALPPIGLSAATREQLDRVMPGTASFLHLHEWIKHGTCYGAAPEGYYSDTLGLIAALNASPVRALFAAGIGRVLTARAIRKAFDEGFGPGAGKRVEVVCRRVGARRLIVELKIGLAGPVAPERSLAALLAAAPEVAPGCGSGIVDRAGIGLGDN